MKLRNYFLAAGLCLCLPRGQAVAGESVLVGNFLRDAPCGIAWVVNDSAAFVLDTGGPYVAGTAAPDDSYHAYTFTNDGAHITFEWGRVGAAAVARIASDKPTHLNLTLSSGWPGWQSFFNRTADGVTGIATATNGPVHWTLRLAPAPAAGTATNLTLAIAPGKPVHLVAGLNRLPSFASLDGTLARAKKDYLSRRAQAAGDWGDFVGAIADNMNNSRLYANDNHRLAHSVSRRWASTPNGSPYFCWDSFLTANLAALDDPAAARNTVRAMLAYQTPEGLVPNFGHWNGRASQDRSQPPVGSLCVWKLHQRDPDDLDFLREVYPSLMRWHDWWMLERNARRDGLLEWGSATGDFQDAQYETGWDDNLHFAAALMQGTTMNCYAVDLCSLWSMDAHYLALIADALGKTQEAVRLRQEAAAMNRHINETLWNDRLKCFCSRFWPDAQMCVPVAASAFGAGFAGDYFSDEKLTHPAGSRQADKINFKWRDAPPLPDMAANAPWSARWRGAFTAPAAGTFRFAVKADAGVRVMAGDRTIVADWVNPDGREKFADLLLQAGDVVPLVIEYHQRNRRGSLRFTAGQLVAAQGRFLTRLTPMNFYPLSAGAPDAARADEALVTLANPARFWGKYPLPTLAYDDPDYHQQEYWRGDVWGPPNYLAWVGLKRYASARQSNEFAARNVALFMRAWNSQGICSENYLSTDGTPSHDPHYTWGALLNLIGLESIVDVDDANRIVLNGTLNQTISLRHIPLLGRRYAVNISPGRAQLFYRGKLVLEASGKVVHAAIP